MIATLARALDNLLGRGDAAVTVPPLDGPLRPNRRLDEASPRVPLAGVDDLAFVAGRIVACAGHGVQALVDGGTWQPLHRFHTDVVALAAVGADGLAVALADGEILVRGGPFDGRRCRAAMPLHCITAMVAHEGQLFVANGAADLAPADWPLDLMRRGASGSVHRIDLASGASILLADGLAWPAGLTVLDTGVVVSEAWRHRLLRLDATLPGQSPARAEPVCTDLPAYPGRFALTPGGARWLVLFAPRNQLVEFVLREPAFRRRMLQEVPRPYWIAPSLRAGRSFYEPLQGGGVRQLGQLKPWAPTCSAGLVVRLDERLQPCESLHSRADGQTHGVNALASDGQRLHAAARGDQVVVSWPS